MRAKSSMFSLSFENFRRILELDNPMSLSDPDIDRKIILLSPEPPEDPNEVVSTDIFAYIKPGKERVCIVLRADGLTYRSIGMIAGLSTSQVKNVIYSIRKRLLAKFDKSALK